MKLALYSQMTYKDFDVPHGWPISPAAIDSAATDDAYERAMEFFEVADEAGFDWLSIAEHHYATSFNPSPNVMAAALAERFKRPTIAVLGVILPLRNPVRVAEEFAMLDAISGGRFVGGLFRGAPVEYAAYGINPAEARSMFAEGVELVQAALTEPEPFGWEGRHHRYRKIAVWPRPRTPGGPPLLTHGTSRDSAIYAARRRMKLGLAGFLVSVDEAAELVRCYREEAAAVGWVPAADDVLYRARIYVGETDEQAQEANRRYKLGDVLGIVSPSGKKAAGQVKVVAATVGPSKFGHHLPGEDASAEYIGNPDTVARRLREDAERIGFGVAELMFVNDWMPHAEAMRSLRRFCDEVLPQLRPSA